MCVFSDILYVTYKILGNPLSTLDSSFGMAFLQPINVKSSIDKKKVEITRFTVLVTLTRKDTLSMAKPESLSIQNQPNHFYYARNYKISWFISFG